MDKILLGLVLLLAATTLLALLLALNPTPRQPPTLTILPNGTLTATP